MKMTKKIIAIVMAVAMLTALLAGCSSGNSNNNNNNNTNSSSQDDSSSSAASSQKEGENTISGTGNNSALSPSMTLFDVEYTLGKSRVKDLMEHEWGRDPESWKDVDMDQKIEYKDRTAGNYYNKKLDNDTTEVTISYENLAETFATPENCVITKMQFEGSPDGTIGKAGVKLFGGKIDLATCTTPDKLETALGSALSSYTKEESDYSSFTSTVYKFDVKNGSVYMYTNTDKDTNTLSKIDTTIDYKEDEETEDDSSTGTKPMSIFPAKSESMWDDAQKLSTSGDSSKLTPSVSLFDKDYTIGKLTLKQLVEDGWGYDTESWKGIDMEGAVEYKKGYTDKTMHNNTAEIDVSIGTYASVSGKPEDCIVTGISIEGSPDGVFTKAGVKLCDGKIDLAEYSTLTELEDALSSATSWVEKRKVSDSYYTYHFLAEDGNGSVQLAVSLDYVNENKIKNYDVDLEINDKYTYEAND